jgi:tRNA threonylcarbamoyladenosine biosynthesis protein TsaE
VKKRQGTTFESSSVEQTRRAGACVASGAAEGGIYGLNGGLGCGKTEFVRGFVAGLNRDCSVRSPTFTLLNVYPAPRFEIYHFDFYRLSSPEELVEIGFADCLYAGGVVLIEWADRFEHLLPGTAREIRFTDLGGTGRLIECDFAVRGVRGPEAGMERRAGAARRLKI